MEYAWRKGFPWADRADPAAVAGRIQALASLNGRYPTARDVLEDGRNKDAPHHAIFTWDDSIAAEQYRLVQAGEIIRAIVIVRTDMIEPKKPVRAFVHVTPPEEENAAYVDILVAMNSPEMRRQVLEKAMKELEIWRETYEGYIEFMSVIAAIDNTHKAIQRSRAEV